VDATVSRKKYERDAARFDPAAADAEHIDGWKVQEITWPTFKVVFTHPKSRRAVGFRFLFDNWDQEPPSLSLYDPETGEELPWSKWPQGVWSAGNAHPVTGKPFLCLAGIREYHIHSSHLNDPWSNYRTRDSYKFGHLIHRVWQRFKDTNG
jgi:hypothetical protein